jgi:ParB family chromosome partitioning protein
MKEAWNKLINIEDDSFIKDELHTIPIENIRPNPYQPRKVFDAKKIEELAQSIRTYGLLQPIIVRKDMDKFQLIAGERRFIACKSLGWTSIPALIREMSDSAMATIALIENLQRENLSYLEEAEGYQKLLDEFNLTQEVLAQRLGKSQSTIANKIRLLKLPARVKELLVLQELTERHARALLKLQNEDSQLRVVNEICNLGMTVKQTDRRVDEILRKNSVSTNRERKKVVIRDIRIFLNTVRQALSILENAGMKPKITETDHGEYFEINIVMRKAKKSNSL